MNKIPRNRCLKSLTFIQRENRYIYFLFFCKRNKSKSCAVVSKRPGAYKFGGLYTPGAYTRQALIWDPKSEPKNVDYWHKGATVANIVNCNSCPAMLGSSKSYCGWFSESRCCILGCTVEIYKASYFIV